MLQNLEFKNLPPSYDVINTKLGQKGPKFVHHVLTVIERSKSITTQNLQSKLGEQFIFQVSFEHYKILMPPHPLLICCDVINSKFGQERS